MRKGRNKRKKREQYRTFMYRDEQAKTASIAVKNSAGDVVGKAVALPPEATAWIKGIFERYREVTGQDPPQTMELHEIARRAGCPLPSANEFQAELSRGMRAAGIDPAVIFAFERTGILITEVLQS
ncbi:MAG: hypothetical protein WD042_05345 [Phycisphaeraceae bacterium]